MVPPPQFRLTVTRKDGHQYTIARDGALREYIIVRGGDIREDESRAGLSRRKLETSTIRISGRGISRRQCSLVWNGRDNWILEDLGSTLCTCVDGEPLSRATPIANRGEFTIGNRVLRLDYELSRRETRNSDTDRNAGGLDDDANASASTTADETTVITRPSRTILDDAAADEGTEATVAAADDSTELAVAAGEPADDGTVIGAAGADVTAAPGDGSFVADTAEIAPETAHVGEKPGVPVAPAIESTEAGDSVVPGGAGPPSGFAADLVTNGLLSEAKANDVRRRAVSSGETFFRTLIRDHTIQNHRQIYDWVAGHLGCELITEVDSLVSAIREVPWLSHGVAERRGILVLEPKEEHAGPGQNNRLRCAAIDPFDIVLQDWVSRCAGRKPDVVAALPQAFFEAIHRLQAQIFESDEELEIGVAVDISWGDEERIRDSLDLQEVPQIVDYFLHRGVAEGASDIHVEPTQEGLLVRNRVDGMLHDDSFLPIDLHPAITSRIKILSGMDVAEKRRPQDGRISVMIRQHPIDVRVATYPTVHGEKVVMRLLDKSALRPSPEHLGLSDRDLALLMDKISAPYGLIMLCGPTGSGKTTTLYSCLGAIDKRSKNVLTIEDPVEYRVKGVHQMQVNEKIGLTFATGLRTILRQDPDVVMVGECRDAETAAMAIQASLTGHIVFSTIHTNDAVGVVSRLLDMKIDTFLVASSLTLAIAQRLVRTVCQHCKTLVDGREIHKSLNASGISDKKLKYLGITIDPEMPYVHRSGCPQCRDTGYSGRRPVFEIFEMNNECRHLVMSAAYNADKMANLGRQYGMTTLVESGVKLIEDGVTTHEEIIRVLGESD